MPKNPGFKKAILEVQTFSSRALCVQHIPRSFYFHNISFFEPAQDLRDSIPPSEDGLSVIPLLPLMLCILTNANSNFWD